jgi:hypothetical protein
VLVALTAMLALGFVIVGIGENEPSDMDRLPIDNAIFVEPHFETKAALLLIFENIIVPDDPCNHKGGRHVVLSVGNDLLPLKLIVDGTSDIISNEYGLFDADLPRSRGDHIGYWKWQRGTLDRRECDVAHFSSRGPADVFDNDLKFWDYARLNWPAGRSVDLYRDIGSDLSMPDLSVSADGLPRLPKGEPQGRQTEQTQWNADDPNDGHNKGPSRHFLLGFQVLIGYGLFPVGLYLVYKAHSDDIGGSERDGTALCYLIGGFFAVLLGSLTILVVNLPIGQMPGP